MGEVEVGAGGDFVPPKNQPFQIDELPLRVLIHLFKFLAWEDQKSMQKLCKGMRYFIQNEYGIHVHLPATNSNVPIRSRSNSPLTYSWQRVTDKMITEAIEGFEGKIIRSLMMHAIHPDLNPSPFQKLIQCPWRLRRVSLKYVDVDFLVGLLTSCRNLSEFRYATGVDQSLAQLARAVEWIEPLPVPREGEQLIEFVTQLPPPTFQIDKLTSLNLRLRELDPNRHSDWGNVVFVLLSLSQRTLRSLRNFSFDVGHCLILKERLQLLGCIGQFLAQCPNLVTLEYAIHTLWTSWSETDRDFGQPRSIDHTGATLPQNVIDCLMQKYGSALLKEVQVQGEEPLRLEQRMLVPINQIMKDAGKTLRSLRDVHFGFYCRVEHKVFQTLLSALPSPSMRDIDICDETGVSFTAGSYELLLSQIQFQSSPPFYGNLEKLCVSRVDQLFTKTQEDDNATGPLSLPRIINRMRALRHFEFVPRTPYYDGNIEEDEDMEQHEAVYDHLRGGRNDSETPDVTFEDVGDVHFQQLQVLKLEGVKISTDAAGRLIQLTNLTELLLHILPEYRHELFGINSGDLLRLMGRLRKLEKMSVSMIYFPEDDNLRSTQLTALDGIGTLKQMRRVVAEAARYAEGNFFYDTELMIQYTFTLGFDDEIWRWRWDWMRAIRNDPSLQ